MLAHKRAHARRMLDHLERQMADFTINAHKSTMDLRDLNRRFSASDLAKAIGDAGTVGVALPGQASRVVKNDHTGHDDDSLVVVLNVLVANEVQIEYLAAAVTWIGDGMFGPDQIRDWGNRLVAAFGRAELH
jgi:hypothetical protein